MYEGECDMSARSVYDLVYNSSVTSQSAIETCTESFVLHSATICVADMVVSQLSVYVFEH